MVALLTLADELTDRLLRSRTIVLGQVVDDESATRINAQLLLLERDDPDADIRFFINSPGGSVSAGLAIYDTMAFISCDVATFATGLAASMGQVLLCAGTRGKRFALPHASIMMHQGSAGIGGVAADIGIQAEQLARTAALMNELLARHTGQPVERIADDSDRDRWFTPHDALAYGMIDRVVGTRREADAAMAAVSASRAGEQR